MARVEVSAPVVTINIASEPSRRSDGALTLDSLLDFAAVLGSHPIPADTPILCSHGTQGHLTDLWIQATVPLADLPETGPDANCPAPDCGHSVSRHAPIGDPEDLGCADCNCARSRERVAMLARTSA